MVGVDYSSLILTVEVGWFLLQRVGGRLALIIHCESKRWRCTLFQLTDFCRTMLSISAAYAVYAVFICLSVCPSVTFMDSVETNKDSFNFFSPSGSHTIFPHQTLWQYSDRTPLPGASNAGGIGNIVCCELNGSTAKCNTHSCDGPWQIDDINTSRW